MSNSYHLSNTVKKVDTHIHSLGTCRCAKVKENRTEFSRESEEEILSYESVLKREYIESRKKNNNRL